MTGNTRQQAESRATNIAREITAKRTRQQEYHGFSVEHDDRYHNAELAQAAGTYALVAAFPGREDEIRGRHWPFPDHWLRHGAPRELLLNAATLIIAEIERLDRLPQQKDEAENGQ